MDQQRIIESRKRADVAYRAMEAVLVEQKEILHKANFELSTGAKIEARLKQVIMAFSFWSVITVLAGWQ